MTTTVADVMTTKVATVPETDDSNGHYQPGCPSR